MHSRFRLLRSGQRRRARLYLTVGPRLVAGLVAIALTASLSSYAQDAMPGATLASLIEYARSRNPEYAAMQFEAVAADERVYPAGALPDPRFRNEFRDITRMESQNATLLPARVGSNRYLFMQDLPWSGKRDLKREAAQFEADGAKGRALNTWSEIATRIKLAYVQLYFTQANERLAQEILDLMAQLEKVANARYTGGLAAQQDVIRAQIEQTTMRSELVALGAEQHHLRTRINGLLARPAQAPLERPQALRPLPAPAKLDFAALEERLRGRNPQLHADDARVRSAEKTRDLAYKNRYPDFTLGFAPIQYRNSLREWEVMLELNIPLQQKTRRSQEREAEAMLSAAKARKDATANQAVAELVESIAALNAGRRTEVLVTGSLLPQADLTFQSALAGYQNGKVDFAILIDAQRQIRTARQTQLKVELELHTRLAEIERLLGEDL